MSKEERDVIVAYMLGTSRGKQRLRQAMEKGPAGEALKAVLIRFMLAVWLAKWMR